MYTKEMYVEGKDELVPLKFTANVRLEGSDDQVHWKDIYSSSEKYSVNCIAKKEADSSGVCGFTYFLLDVRFFVY